MVGLLMMLMGCDEGVGIDGISTSGVTSDDGTESAPGVTWYRDVQPMLAENCLSCHAADGITFSLEEYSVASVMAGPIAEVTAAGTMPPWPADEDDCLPLKDRRALTDDQITTLQSWSDLGAPEGDPADSPAAVSDAGSGIETDLWGEMATAYVPDPDAEDDYRCFVVDPGLAEETFVSGAVVFPGNYGVVHHVILYTDPDNNSEALDAAEEGEGYTCFGGPGFDNTAVIGGWVPGSEGLLLPEDSGLRVSAGTKVILQMHYHPDGTDSSDQTAFALDLEESVGTEVYLYPLADTNLNIPPSTTDHAEGFSTTFNYGLDLKLWGGTPHMHLLGTSIKITVTPPDSEEEQCIIDIPDWDFDYQQFYRLEEAYIVENGSTLSLECIYDNPTDETINWGDGTGDEMCLIYAMVSL
ncbi:MAG: hypothetical protein ACI8RZ_003274 [Myxococcota bacterium]|jgi:hypothetical protein